MTPDQLAHDLNRLADKAINRVALGVGMTELMPEDVRLLQDAAKELLRVDRSERIAQAELAGVLAGIPLPQDPATLSREGR